MIRINCTNCKAQLSIDEAFAGGVCRCQYCGTIQTVPKHLSSPAAAAEAPVKAAAGAGAAKELYRKKTKGDIGMSSGLDAIAEIVASSGLSGSGLSSGGYGGRRSLTGEASPAMAAPAAPAKNRQMLMVLGGAGVLIVLLLGVVIGLLVRGSGGGGGGGTNPVDPNGNASSSGAANSGISTAATPADPKGPSFLHLGLSDPSVVFLLDRGDATRPYFDYVKMACLNAIDSLRPEQKFQVICWSAQDNDPKCYPPFLTAAGNAAEVKGCGKWLDDIFAFGATDPAPALKKAFASHPAAIVIATGKVMDDLFVQAVFDAAKASPTTKVYCLSLTESASTKAMIQISHQTNATHRVVSLEELQSVKR
jgi:hypothetical protein